MNWQAPSYVLTMLVFQMLQLQGKYYVVFFYRKLWNIFMGPIFVFRNRDAGWIVLFHNHFTPSGEQPEQRILAHKFFFHKL